MQSTNVNLVFQKVNSMGAAFYQALPSIIIGFFVFLLFFILGKLARRFLKKVLLYKRHYNLILVLGRLIEWIFISLGALVALSVIFPSITPADLLAGLGLGGVAIAFAFKDILKNYLAGILILLQQPFRENDEIIFKEFEGIVEFIDTRTTILKSYDGRKILIPNGELYTNVITVNTAYEIRCSEYVIGIGCSDDVEKATKIILNCIDALELIHKTPAPEVWVTELNKYTTDLRVRWWTSPTKLNIMRIQSAFLQSVKTALYDAGIDIPFPTQVVLWHNQTEKNDKSRTKHREGWPP